MGKYKVDYGANNYSDTLSNIDDAINRPRTNGVRLREENGWLYRSNGEFIPSNQLGDRISLNVKGDSRLLRMLDELMTNGQYVDDYGNIIKINRTDFYYKTFKSASQWGMREDPITLYFRGNINNETINAIAQISKNFQRGALTQASKSVPWMIVEQNPSSTAIQRLIYEASKVNSNLAKVIYKNCYKPNGEYLTSSGLFNTFVRILKEYKSLIGLS